MSRDITSERMTGIEPAFSAWEADVLPLNYIRRGAHTSGRGLRVGLRDRGSADAWSGAIQAPRLLMAV
jgi:hypothetical protein